MTLTDIVIAFPFAYFMARIASPRMRTVLFVVVLLPLWSSYLVRIYAWRLILSKNGALNWSLTGLGLPDAGLAYTNTAMWIVFSYVWLPFMILPVYAALERIPRLYLEASRDLGARNWRTFRRVVLPLALPGVVAGSIFTFSLTLGDFITPILVRQHPLHRQRRLPQIGIDLNLPFAAAYATVPLAVMAVYLVVAAGSARSRRSEEGRAGRYGLALWSLLVMLFLWMPLGIILVYAFNTSNIQSWPIPGFTLKWFRVAWEDQEVRTALMLSLKVCIRRDGDRARARDDGRRRGPAFPLLRTRGVLVSARASARPPGSDHGDRALVLLHLLRACRSRSGRS